MRCDKLEILTNGITYDLWSERSRFRWISQNGFGSPGISRITERGPFQHGLTNIDFRLNPRIIQLAITAIARNTQQHFDNRQLLLKMFGISNDVSVLKYEMPDGTIRHADVLYNGGLDLDFNRMSDMRTKSYAVELIVPDATWYDPETKTITYGSQVQTDLVFPITFPIEFGTDSIISGIPLQYNGTWLSYPGIEITGPINNVLIENLSTDEKIQLDYNIELGEVVTIDLTYGIKTIINNSGDNLIGVLSEDSDLATFHLATSGEVADGINDISIIGTSTDVANTQIVISYFERYTGV